MNRFVAHIAGPLRPRPGHAKAAKLSSSKALGILGGVALGLAAGFPATPAQAQFFSWSWWSRNDGPPPIPPRDVGPPHGHWHAAVPPRLVALGEFRRQATRLGLHLVAKPRRTGAVYIAFATDGQGLLHHLAFDPRQGKIIDNGVSQIGVSQIGSKPADRSQALKSPPLPPLRPTQLQAHKTRTVSAKPTTLASAPVKTAKPALAPVKATSDVLAEDRRILAK